MDRKEYLYELQQTSPRKQTLVLYTFYPNIPKGECGRGPYCLSREPITKAQFRKTEKVLLEHGAIPVDRNAHRA